MGSQKSTILTAAAMLLFVVVGSCFAIAKMADSNPGSQCNFHLGTIACTPQT